MRKAALAMMAALAPSLLAVPACDFSLGFGDDARGGSGSHTTPSCDQPYLEFSPQTTTRAEATQRVEIEVHCAELVRCQPQVLFGGRPVAVIGQSHDLGQPTDDLSLEVAVPSAWQGELAVRFRCGDVTADGGEARYTARPVGWFASAATGYAPFAEERCLICPVLTEPRADGGIDAYSFGGDRELLRRSFVPSARSLEMDTTALAGLPAAEQEILLSGLLVDVDGDGCDELVWSDWATLLVAARQADGRWTLLQQLDAADPSEQTAGARLNALSDDPSIWQILAGDLDGDSDDDLVLMMDDSPPRVALNEAGRLRLLADGVLDDEALDGTGGALLDLDGDGDLDLVGGTGWVAEGAQVDYRDRIYHNRGDGRFAPAGPLSAEHTNTWMIEAFAMDGQRWLVASQLDAPPAVYRITAGGPQPLGSRGIAEPGILVAAQGTDTATLIQLGSQTDSLGYSPTLRRYDWDPAAGRFRLVHDGPLPEGMAGWPAPFAVLDVDGDAEPDLLTPGGLWLWRDFAG
jgi:hypothetical protein